MAIVAKLSQKGYDAKTTGDQNVIFSADFPTLKEHYSGSYDTDKYKGFVYQPVYEHNLDYYPFFLVFNPDGQFVLGNDNWGVDDKKIYFKNTTPAQTGVYRFIIYRLDLFKDYKAPVINPGSGVEAGERSNIVLKMSKRGKDVTSSDLRDFSIHSDTRSPLVHQVSTKHWVGPNVLSDHTVERTLSYNPIAFGFSKTAIVVNGLALVSNLISGGQSVPLLTRDAGTGAITITSVPSASQDTSIVIFKDPFIAPTTIKVDY